MQEESIRQNRTKNHFKIALTELIKEQGFHTITVKDLVQQAQYNRSTFYVHYHDKFELAEELLHELLYGLEEAVQVPYKRSQTINTDKLKPSHFEIISYIHQQRFYFDLINYDDTLPGLHRSLPNKFLDIYKNYFTFETISDQPVNMGYFKHYIAFGFYGLIQSWIQEGFQESQDDFIYEVIELSKTHIRSVQYIGDL
ncbi:TetR/AcrR family transcriptional regulator [Alkalibacillus sp. S2W]|uniref:TetR/AcrR family transcriptional regulator n=1 Tax=Alkalibacillus sp. S2W TaxID=3386553 RepID=UPI00398D11C6